MPTTPPLNFTPLRSATQSYPAVRRPWRQFFNLTSFTRPYTLGETQLRLKRNLSYFRVNYTLLFLLFLFLSLLYHPISLIVFFVLSLFLWYYLYFSRDEPLVILSRPIDDRVVAIGLGVVTVLVIGFTGVWLNVVVSFGVGLLIVVLHGIFRGVDDLYFDEEDVGDGGLVSVVGSPARVATGYARI